MARVLVGVTGGIAAYKACELVRLLVKGGHEVVPLVTPGAERFVRAETFFALARRSPTDDLYLHLTRADLLVVAPVTANTLAKLAHGEADNLVAEAALAHRGPVLLAPAMNPRMWAHSATQSNLDVVRSRGVVIVGPEEGETAEGEWGLGRMAEPEEIYRRCRELLSETDHLKLLGVGPIIVGVIVSFVVAYASIAWLLKFVSSNKITAFVWYRVALGLVLIVVLAAGWMTAT
jgi:phosphopantothenoylcysteine decarboxylase/phosphopantothenate--cysteine ligase